MLLLEPAWEKKRLSLDIDLAEAEILANQDLMAEVWTNVIGNAVKFSPEGSTVGVRLFRERAGDAAGARAAGATDGDVLVVEVSDEGEGIPEEAAQRIFEKFYQADTSHSQEGNGLGLSLAKRVVEAHGGTIEAFPRTPRGTLFRVTLGKTEA